MGSLKKIENVKAGNELPTFVVHTFFWKKSNYLILYAKETKDMRNSKRRTQNPSISLKKPKSDELPLLFKWFKIDKLNLYWEACKQRHQFTWQMSKLAGAIVRYLQNWISPFFLIRNFSPIPTAKEHSWQPLTIASRFQKSFISRFQGFPSVTSLRNRVWNWSHQYINYLDSTPCLKPDETGFMFDCWIRCSIFDCSITFDCFSVRLAKFLGEFDYVRFSGPNQSQSNDWIGLKHDFSVFIPQRFSFFSF